MTAFLVVMLVWFSIMIYASWKGVHENRLEDSFDFKLRVGIMIFEVTVLMWVVALLFFQGPGCST